MSDIREGFQVEFDVCGHTMVYDKFTDHGRPEVGELGLCRQCPSAYGLGVERTVISIRQCWIETAVTVHFTRPENGERDRR